MIPTTGGCPIGGRRWLLVLFVMGCICTGSSQGSRPYRRSLFNILRRGFPVYWPTFQQQEFLPMRKRRRMNGRAELEEDLSRVDRPKLIVLLIAGEKQQVPEPMDFNDYDPQFLWPIQSKMNINNEMDDEDPFSILDGEDPIRRFLSSETSKENEMILEPQMDVDEYRPPIMTNSKRSADDSSADVEESNNFIKDHVSSIRFG